MKLNTEFYKLPLRFDQALLRHELSQFSETDWRTHSTLAAGNASIIMASVGGTFIHDFAMSGPTKSTAFLERCPYLKQILERLANPISRCRITKLAGATKTPAQADCNYHWFRRLPIYVPIITNSAVRLFCNKKSLQMAAGEAWIFDNTYPHRMINMGDQDCFHLVIETKDSSILAQAEHTTFQHKDIPYLPDNQGQIHLEPYCFEVLTPQEFRKLTTDILSDIETAQMPKSDFSLMMQTVEQLRHQWEKIFSRFGHHSTGELSYQDVIVDFKNQIVPKIENWLPSDGKGKYAVDVISSMLLMYPPTPKRLNLDFITKKRRKKKLKVSKINKLDFQCPKFERPVFILSAPRAGSTLLFNTLSQFSDLWNIGGESHEIFEGIDALNPAAHNFSSNRLTEEDAFPHNISALKKRFACELQNRDERTYLEFPVEQRLTSVRLLEKTPKNVLRIPFIKAAFPDALFIYIYRDPRENISSMVEGWRLQSFISYKQLPGWPFKNWSFPLTPGWESLKECSLVEIAASQWKMSNVYILDDLQALPKSSWYLLHYSDLIREPKKMISEISQFAGFHWDQHIEQLLSKSLPLSSSTVSAPSPDKWRKNEPEIASVLPSLEPIISRLGF